MSEPFQLFDAAPSSCSMLREKPLGINYKEPTLRELMTPSAPDRSVFRGGVFDRRAHAYSRKRLHDATPRRAPDLYQPNHNNPSPPTSTTPGSTSLRQTPSPRQLHGQETPSASINLVAPPLSSSVTPSSLQQHPHDGTTNKLLDLSVRTNNNDAMSNTSFGTNLELSQRGGGQQQQQQQASPDKSLTLLSRAFNKHGQQQSKSPSSSTAYEDEQTRLEREARARRRVRRQPRPTPTSQLPCKGKLPDDAELVLADIHSFAVQSARTVDDFVQHGKEVVERKADTSPIKVFDQMLKRTSSQETKRGSGDPLNLSTRKSQPGRGGGGGGGGRKPAGAKSSASSRKRGATVVVTTDGDGEREGSRHSEDDGDNNDEDQELVPGIVYARSQMPPWVQEKDPDLAAAAMALAQTLSRGGRKKKRVVSSPRFAKPTEARRKSLTSAAAASSPSSQQQHHQDGGGGGGGGDQQQQGGGGDNNAGGDDTNQEPLEARNMQFAGTLRPEDRAELERRKQALREQRQRHLDEMILARLAPAEREAKLADRGALEPYRKYNDRNLPFPDQAARDRLLHAAVKVPPLVTEGLHQIEVITAQWRPSSRGGDSSSPHLLISNVASLSATGTGVSATPRVGSGGELPSEGSPRMLQPTGGQQAAQKLAQAQSRFDMQERDQAAKYANLETRLAAKHIRAAKKTMM